MTVCVNVVNSWGVVESNVPNDGAVGFTINERAARDICGANESEDIIVCVEMDDGEEGGHEGTQPEQQHVSAPTGGEVIDVDAGAGDDGVDEDDDALVVDSDSDTDYFPDEVSE